MVAVPLIVALLLSPATATAGLEQTTDRQIGEATKGLVKKRNFGRRLIAKHHVKVLRVVVPGRRMLR